MKYAIIEVGTKQYQVQEGDVLEVQKMDVQGEVVLDRVLMVVDGDKVEVGTPTVDGLKVYASYVEDKKGEKVQVFKYKSKSKYRKLRGARQTYSYLKIQGIGSKPVAKKAETAPKAEMIEVAEKPAKKLAAKKPAAKKAPAKKAAK